MRIAADIGGTVMIVDDETENLRVLATLLSQQGHTVRSFSNGKAALKSAQADPPNLILLDIRMPHMDGFEVCTQLKANASTKDIPVLFLSAIDAPGDKVRAFELGGDDYIAKPFQSEEVLARINTHLTVSRYRRDLENMNRKLEVLVEERTEDLIEANKSLRKEIEVRRSAQAAHEESEERYRSIVTTANEGIVTVDPQMMITFANAAMAQLIGSSVDDIVGRHSLDFIPEEDREDILSRFKDRERGVGEQFEGRIVRKDGQIRWVHRSSSPIMAPDGRYLGTIIMFTDITQRKQSEIELERAYAEIAQLTQQIEADKNYLQEEIKLEHDFEQIIGNSDAIKYVLYRLEQVAETDAAVIILGETGTGKELIARALHSTSARAERPLIKVNCATLPAQFIESELFGHVKGAFTDAVADRQGRFELADKGTLFLDEIGELPLDLQPKLLRVLQDGEFERLGDNRTVKTEVRIIAATNRDIKALVAEGKFREDLWYRLNVFPITLPPLRDRKADIPLLVNHFVRRIGKRIGREINRIPNSVMKELAAYDWPGNVRELKHVLERSVIISDGRSLSLHEQLLPSAKHAPSTKALSHADMERHHILRVLKQTRWVVEGPKGAARILKLHPNTLRYRMKKHGIRRPE